MHGNGIPDCLCRGNQPSSDMGLHHVHHGLETLARITRLQMLSLPLLRLGPDMIDTKMIPLESEDRIIAVGWQYIQAVAHPGASSPNAAQGPGPQVRGRQAEEGSYVVWREVWAVDRDIHNRLPRLSVWLSPLHRNAIYHRNAATGLIHHG